MNLQEIIKSTMGKNTNNVDNSLLNLLTGGMTKADQEKFAKQHPTLNKLNQDMSNYVDQGGNQSQPVRLPETVGVQGIMQAQDLPQPPVPEQKSTSQVTQEAVKAMLNTPQQNSNQPATTPYLSEQQKQYQLQNQTNPLTAPQTPLTQEKVQAQYNALQSFAKNANTIQPAQAPVPQNVQPAPVSIAIDPKVNDQYRLQQAIKTAIDNQDINPLPQAVTNYDSNYNVVKPEIQTELNPFQIDQIKQQLENQDISQQNALDAQRIAQDEANSIQLGGGNKAVNYGGYTTQEALDMQAKGIVPKNAQVITNDILNKEYPRSNEPAPTPVTTASELSKLYTKGLIDEYNKLSNPRSYDYDPVKAMEIGKAIQENAKKESEVALEQERYKIKEQNALNEAQKARDAALKLQQEKNLGTIGAAEAKATIKAQEAQAKALAKSNPSSLANQISSFKQILDTVPNRAGTDVIGRTLDYARRLENPIVNLKSPNETKFESMKNLLLGTIMRGVGGEKGAMSDRDMARAQQALPQLTDTYEQRKSKMKALETLVNNGSTLGQLADKIGITDMPKVGKDVNTPVNIAIPQEASVESANKVNNYKTEADVPSNLPKGTHITIGGRPAIWE